jgi:hypothetical protein
VADIQTTIRGWLGVPGVDDELAEPALDVCLFARYPWPVMATNRTGNEES